MITVILLLTLAVISGLYGRTATFAALFTLAVIVVDMIFTGSGIVLIAAMAVFTFIYSFGFFWLANRVHTEIPLFAIVLFFGLTGWFFLPLIVTQS